MEFTADVDVRSEPLDDSSESISVTKTPPLQLSYDKPPPKVWPPQQVLLPVPVPRKLPVYVVASRSTRNMAEKPRLARNDPWLAQVQPSLPVSTATSDSLPTPAHAPLPYDAPESTTSPESTKTPISTTLPTSLVRSATKSEKRATNAPRTMQESPTLHRLLSEIQLQRKETAAERKQEATTRNAELSLQKRALANEEKRVSNEAKRDSAELFLKKLELKEEGDRAKKTTTWLKRIERAKPSEPPPHFEVKTKKDTEIDRQKNDAPRRYQFQSRTEQHPHLLPGGHDHSFPTDEATVHLQHQNLQTSTPHENELYKSHRLATDLSNVQVVTQNRDVESPLSRLARDSPPRSQRHHSNGMRRHLRSPLRPSHPEIVESVSFDKEGRKVSVTKRIPDATSGIYILDRDGGLHMAHKDRRPSPSNRNEGHPREDASRRLRQHARRADGMAYVLSSEAQP